MKKLIQGIVDFRNNLTDEKRDLFAKLALGQKPDALFIACSDSRVVPHHFASTNPGDLFVLRNIGNLIPKESDSKGDSSASAAIEFAISSLNISDIIVCGHSECGAMQALLNDCQGDCGHLSSWLRHAKPSLTKLKSGYTLNKNLSELNQLSQINILQQIENIKTYSSVAKKLKEGKLQIHGWWFDIARADVYRYEESLLEFVIIDTPKISIDESMAI